MDPFSIVASVVSLTAIGVEAAKKLHDIAGAYEDVPVTVAMLSSELTVISIALAQLQGLVLRRQDLAPVWGSKGEITIALETALTGCMVVFSCLQDELGKLQLPASAPSQYKLWTKLKFMFNQDRLKQLLTALQGQQTSLTLLLQLLEMDALADIHKAVTENRETVVATVVRTQSLRSMNPNVRIAPSIFDADITAPSPIVSVAPSDIDFQFDNIVLNSQAYRRAFAKAQSAISRSTTIEEEDLIDVRDEPKRVDTGTKLEKASEELHMDVQKLSLEKETTDSTGIGDIAKALQTSPKSAFARTDSEYSVTERASVRTDSGFSTYEDHGDEKSRSLDSLNRPLLRKPVADSPTRPKPKMCAECNKVITGKHVKALGATWHLSCFICLGCGASVAESVYILEDDSGLPITMDYSRGLSMICYVCGTPARSSHISTLNRRYHLEALRCGTCDREMDSKECYYSHMETRTKTMKVACLRDHCYLHANTCPTCELPVLTRYVGRTVGRVEIRWHEWCYVLQEQLGLHFIDSSASSGYFKSLRLGISADDFGSFAGGMLKTFKDVLNRLGTLIPSVVGSFEELEAKLVATPAEESRVLSDTCSKLVGLAVHLVKAVHVLYTDETSFKTEFLELCKSSILGRKGWPLSIEQTATVATFQPFNAAAKNLIANGLRQSLKLEEHQANFEKVNLFVSRMELSSLDELVTPPNDDLRRRLDDTYAYACVFCDKLVSDSAFADISDGEDSRWHLTCWPCAMCRRTQLSKYEDLARGEIGVKCGFCGHHVERGFQTISATKQAEDLYWLNLAKVLRSFPI